MELQRLLSGDPSRTSMLYLVIGGISLAKAIALRNDRQRFRRELIDAGLFLGVGLLLRRYGQLRERKRDELMESVPDWLAGESAAESPGIRDRARQRFGSEPEPEPTLRERAMRVVNG